MSDERPIKEIIGWRRVENEERSGAERREQRQW